MPGADDTLALGINDQGQIVGAYYSGGTFNGFLYTNGSYTTLDDPAGTNTRLSGINNAGEIVGWDEVVDVPAGVPEASTSAMMLVGFTALGLAGFHATRRQLSSLNETQCYNGSDGYGGGDKSGPR
jgi:probable HAF family extracellular repeat protein